MCQLLVVDNQTYSKEMFSLYILYEPPTVAHLLEAGQWDLLKEKLDMVFEEINDRRNDSHDHILETFYSIASAFSYLIHKNNHSMIQILQNEYIQMHSHHNFQTIQQLREWAFKAIDRLQNNVPREMKDSRSNIIEKVHQYILANLEQATLRSIADHVFLNPTYLSKIYKDETGVGIGDFLFRLRMEKAAYLLENSTEKVYKIGQSLGYFKTSYFIKIFKDYFGSTPQKYRENKFHVLKN